MFDWTDLLESTRKAAGLDPALGTDAELGDAARFIEATRTALDAIQAHLLAELDQRRVTDRDRGLVTHSWLAHETKIPPAVARQRVVVATKLRTSFPAVDAALTAGDITWDHAKVIVDAAIPRLADQIVAIQDTLVELAADTGFSWWKTQVRGIVDLLDADGGHTPDTDPSEVTLARTYGGRIDVRGHLSGIDGEIVDHVLDSIADELFRSHAAIHTQDPEYPIPTRKQLRGEAFVEMARRAQAIDLNSSTAPRTEVVLVVPASDPTDVQTPGGVKVQDGTVRMLLCDPDFHPVVLDHLGVPIDMGHRARYATAAQRRALEARDGGCIFPGHDCPMAWCDAHHVEPFTPTRGPTDLGNLAPFCRTAHRVVHRPGWRMYAHPDGWFFFVTPTGDTFWSQRHGRQRTDPTPAVPPD